MVIQPLGPFLRDAKRRYVLSVLRTFHGNRTRTAEALGITYRGLTSLINHHLRDHPDLTPPSRAYTARRPRTDG